MRCVGIVALILGLWVTTGCENRCDDVLQHENVGLRQTVTDLQEKVSWLQKQLEEARVNDAVNDAHGSLAPDSADTTAQEESSSDLAAVPTAAPTEAPQKPTAAAKKKKQYHYHWVNPTAYHPKSKSKPAQRTRRVTASRHWLWWY